MAQPATPIVFWPLLLYGFLVLVVVIGLMVVSYLLGEQHRERATIEPYECGLFPTGSARLRLPADFYLIAVFFVIFDLESIFVYAWAVAVREVGWTGFGEILLFIGILLVALFYLWRDRALEWRNFGQQPPAQPEERTDPIYAVFRFIREFLISG